MILSVMRAFINWIHFQQSHYMFKGQRVNDNPLNYTVKNKKGASVIVMVDVKKKRQPEVTAALIPTKNQVNLSPG